MFYYITSFSIIFLTIFIGIVPILFNLNIKKKKKLNAIEIIIISIIVLLLYFSILSILLINIPDENRRGVSIFAIFIPIILGVINIFKNPYILLKIYGNKNGVLLGFSVFYMVCIFLLLSSNFNFPNNLPDGPYVDKLHNTSVKIQVITGNLPADNVIPYVVQEYLARGIVLKRNNPILPGQQITNRPIMASLITMPIRTILFKNEPRSDLPEFEYVGKRWPDYRILTADEDKFQSFLGVAIFLNLLIIFSLGLFINKSGISTKIEIIVILLLLSSPYFLFQTVFTWPKMFAGFFILTGIYTYVYHKNNYIFGLLTGLAYLSHPYAIAYFLSGSLLILYNAKFFGKLVALKLYIQYLLSFLITILPWFVWVKYLALPSDLISQNFSVGSQTFIQNIWARLSNFSNVLSPWHMYDANFIFNNFLIKSNLNIIGAIGLLTSLSLFTCLLRNQAAIYNMEYAKDKTTLVYLLIGSLLLVCVFSGPALPILHGLQPFVIFLTYFVAIRSSFKLGKILLFTQILINISLLIIYYQLNINIS